MLEIILAAIIVLCISTIIYLSQKLSDKEKRLSESSIENAQLKERINMYENQREQLERAYEERFKNIANEALRRNSELLKAQQEGGLNAILNPLKENIEHFKRTITENFISESADRRTLSQRIDELKMLQQTIGKEAKELTTALRGNSKVQGDWGEMILDSLLEKSGLEKGVHYKVQEQIKEVNIRPDVIMYYPDGRSVVIDSKVSLTAFVNLVNAENDTEAEEFKRQHVKSVRKHVDELAAKTYQNYAGVQKADYVMMFIPNEPAYIAAMQADKDLWEYAFDRKVIILSPTHLLTVLSMLSQLWRQNKITQNIIKVAEESGKMYDKFVGFIDDMLKIAKAIEQAKAAYDNAMTKLSTGNGNLVKRAEDLKKIGAKASKSLPQNLIDKQEE